MNTAPKYNLSLEVKQGNTSIYAGEALMDVIFPKLPATGKFTVAFKHENLSGFAKILCWLSSSASLVGAKILTKADWRSCAITGTNIPEVVTIEFATKAAAISTIYASLIACMVTGNWKSFPEDSRAAFEKWLDCMHANGVNMFFDTGKFCGGRLMPLKSRTVKVKADLVETIMKAKAELAGTKGKETVKAKAEPKPAVKKAARKPKAKAEVKPEATAEGETA